MGAREETRLPKWWHGGFLVILGLAIAFLGGSGFLGGMHHSFADLETATFFLFGGFCIAVLGFILLVWGARRSLRADVRATSTTPIPVKRYFQREERATLRNLFFVTIATVLLGVIGPDWRLLSHTGAPFHPNSPIRKVVFFASVYLISQLPFLIALVKLRDKIDRLAVAVLFAYACVSILSSTQPHVLPSFLHSGRGLLPVSQITLAVFAWQARNRLPRREGEGGLLLACFVASLLYMKFYVWLDPLIYFRF